MFPKGGGGKRRARGVPAGHGRKEDYWCSEFKRGTPKAKRRGGPGEGTTHSMQSERTRNSKEKRIVVLWKRQAGKN